MQNHHLLLLCRADNGWLGRKADPIFALFVSKAPPTFDQARHFGPPPATFSGIAGPAR